MDLKSKNILLNRNHTLAKIADVGLSRGMLHTLPHVVSGLLTLLCTPAAMYMTQLSACLPCTSCLCAAVSVTHVNFCST